MGIDYEVDDFFFFFVFLITRIVFFTIRIHCVRCRSFCFYFASQMLIVLVICMQQWLSKPSREFWLLVQIALSTILVPAEYFPCKIQQCNHSMILVRWITQRCVLMQDARLLSMHIYCIGYKCEINVKNIRLCVFIF